MAKCKESQIRRQYEDHNKSVDPIRSRTMRAVKSKDTAPELIVRKFLHSKGLRYLLHDRRLPGTPDLVFPRYRVALFVNGCFWHQHVGCKRSKRPKTNSEYWNKKLDKNIERDLIHKVALEEDGWKVLIVWECEASDNEVLYDLEKQIRLT